MESSKRQRLHVQPNLVPESFLQKYSADRGHRDTIGHTPPRPPTMRFTGASPQSPAARASPGLLSTRKILERPQGPSSRLASSTMRHSSNLATSTPRSIFKSTANGNNAKFAFSPRVPPNVARESFPAATPGRSLRASTADITGRSMARTSSTHLFHMRIPSPDPELDGEALAKQVPDDPGRVGSIYADEFLAHLCPPDLDDLQRRQFFCILDLRRLKYAANDVFAKKDWKINIMNFAKEYEKSRSLIMLRYGLYEFKTVPVSTEVMKKWKAENNIPEEEEEEPEEAATPRPNGTQGILARASNKRRAEDDLTKDSFMAASAQNKRRGPGREPLSETANAATPAPAKNKRHAEVLDEADENRRNKMQKASPSATKSLFESIANKKPSTAPVASATPAQTPAKSLFESGSTFTPAANPFAAASQNGGSVFGGGLKAGVASKNIFGHLSEESSAKSSANDDADAEEETEDESEGGEESEAQEVSQSDEPSAAASGGTATPSQFGSGLFSIKKAGVPAASSVTSSEAGEAPKGPSLFDRVTLDKNGEPMRATFTTNGTSISVNAQERPISSLKRAGSPAKESSTAPADKTWKPDTPIKFGGGGTSSLFSGASTTPAGSLFGSKPAAPAATPSLFQPSTVSEGAELQARDFASPSTKPTEANKGSELGSNLFSSSTPMFGQEKKAAEGDKPTSSLFGSSVFSANSDSALKPKQPTLFGAPKTTEAKEEQSQSSTLFGTPVSGSAKPSGGIFGSVAAQSTPPTTTTPSLFGASTSQPSAPMFGAKPTSSPEKAEPVAPEPKQPSGGTDAGSVFGVSSTQNGASKGYTFGGSAPPPAAALPPKTEAAAKGATDAASVFGAASTGEKKITFGGSSATATPASSAPTPLFGSTAPVTAEAPKPQPTLFGSSSLAPSEPLKAQPSLFGSSTPAVTEAPKPQPSLFGSSTPAPTEAPKSLFATGSSAPSEAKPQTTGFSFGSSTNTSNIFGGPNPPTNNTSTAGSSLFGGAGAGGGSSSFTFSAGPSGGSFNNPFATGGNSTSSTPSFNFGESSQGNQPSSTSFTFGAGGSGAPSTSAPGSSSFTFGGNTQQPSGAPVFGADSNATSGSSMFSFSAGAPSGPSPFSQQPANAAQSMFGHLGVPGGGSSTGTNTPFFGGASSLATTPATGTPEPETKQHDEEKQADEDGKPQEQISLTEGGPGEEDEDVVYEVRAKALKFVPEKPGSDTDSPGAKKDKKNPWKTQGVGPFRLLKHKTTGAVRMLLRAEPRGHVALNRAVLASVDYKVENGGKYVKVMTANADGSGLETWMLQVKTNQAAQGLAEALEKNKSANKK
ncbi:Ran-binding protein [Pleurostoma richardsiae]|uniref:Ran-binding protein n=1 Tax=Pleurostoma richardsiae TaxID=41990 RepID=A0AA38RH91_9PEZI|nr:Ran-binding protein [Pleurostoma richardsiae]